jgi:hypothetical protein
MTANKRLLKSSRITVSQAKVFKRKIANYLNLHGIGTKQGKNGQVA